MKKFIAVVLAATCCLLAKADESLLNSLLNQAKASGDTELGGLASALTEKVKTLGASLGTNAVVKEKLDEMLKALTGGKDSDALASAYKLAAGAKLSPEQTGLVKEVGNLTSAFAVQKNFAALEGSQSDVATVVNSLRNGEVATMIPALKSIGQNAKLTDGQKELFTRLMDNYAPGLKKIKEIKIPGF